MLKLVHKRFDIVLFAEERVFSPVSSVMYDHAGNKIRMETINILNPSGYFVMSFI